MMQETARMPRLYLEGPLAIGQELQLGQPATTYLLSVLRLAKGDGVLVFDGQSGEFRARLNVEGRKRVRLLIEEMTRPQPPASDLLYLFAPLKHARLDYMIQKAVEMGAGRIRPVITQHTQVRRINAERMRANAIEAAEQCGILTLPRLEPEEKLGPLLADFAAREPGRRLIFCDEAAAARSPLALLSALKPTPSLAVLIGPEGGFSEDERTLLRHLPFVTAISLGPRILRADTAAVAALALLQASLGDW